MAWRPDNARLILEPPACRLVVCIDAGQGDPGELVRTLSRLDGAADCALFLYAPEGEDDAALQALRLAAAGFPGPNRVLPAASRPDREARPGSQPAIPDR